MPSVSPKQHRFMEMIAHDPQAAKRVAVPQSVGRDFVAADKMKAKPQKLASALKNYGAMGNQTVTRG